MKEPSQNDRVLKVLIANGAQGTSLDDWDRGPDSPACDGGSRVTRLHARICDLRERGHVIVDGPEKGRFKTYVLVHLKREHGPVLERLQGGWVRTHYCRACDFAGVRPCGSVCPTCERDAVLTVDFNARPRVAERRAA